MVCQPGCCAEEIRNVVSQSTVIQMFVCDLAFFCSTRPARILIFNCTSGRSGDAFLGSMLARGTEQLKQYASSEDVNTFFDRVIFCANVTYADGGFKGGK